ncbi:MAG: hypothetical protein QXX68_02755 [Candidatus Pacearchaeota archaeon]
MRKTKKRVTKRKKTLSSKKIEELLVENFVGLQKAMTNLSVKFEMLADNISKLLEVLELSAKSYLEKEKIEGGAELEKRINFLIEQNKAIAEGLLLIDDTLRKQQELTKKETQQVQPQKVSARPLPTEA